MEKKLYELTIDPELRDYIPPLSDNEYQILTEQIIREGCNEELIVWSGTIIDGHNRYRICHENNIPFAFREMDFESKEQAMLWMAKNQLGRRNLQPYQKCELVIPIESVIKAEAERQRRQNISNTKKGKMPQISAPCRDSRDIMSDMAGVSHDTYAKAKWIAQNAGEDDKKQLRTGKAFINTVYRTLFKPEREPQAQQKRAEKKPNPEIEPQQVKDDNGDFVPIVYLEKPFEVPTGIREEPDKTPRPFSFVKDQVQFSIENMIRNLEIAVNWLRDEDQDKVSTLLDMLEEGFDRAEALLPGQKEE